MNHKKLKVVSSWLFVAIFRDKYTTILSLIRNVTAIIYYSFTKCKNVIEKAKRQT